MFLFQTGSIRRKASAKTKKELLDGFYSKLVRLEGLAWYWFLCLGFLFLFQTGSIRSNLNLLGETPRTPFLFQTGSIRSR